MEYLRGLVVRGDGHDAAGAPEEESKRSAPPLSAEEMRRKRLAKLDGPPSAGDAAAGGVPDAIKLPTEEESVAKDVAGKDSKQASASGDGGKDLKLASASTSGDGAKDLKQASSSSASNSGSGGKDLKQASSFPASNSGSGGKETEQASSFPASGGEASVKSGGKKMAEMSLASRPAYRGLNDKAAASEDMPLSIIRDSGGDVKQSGNVAGAKGVQTPVAKETPQVKATAQGKEPVDVVDKALTSVFQISLRPVRDGITHYFPIVSEELQSQKISVDNFDSVFSARFYADPNDLIPRPVDSPLRYAVGCLERLEVSKRAFKVETYPLVHAALEMSRQILMSYTTTYLSEPGMIMSSCLAKSASGSCAADVELVDMLKRRETQSKTMILLQDLYEEVAAQKVGAEIVSPIINTLRIMANDHPEDLPEATFYQLCASKKWGSFVGELIARERKTLEFTKIKFGTKKVMHPTLNRMVTMQTQESFGRRVEGETLLGPFFSCLKIVLEPPTAKLTKDFQNSLRVALLSRRTSLGEAVLDVCRASTEAKDEVLDWFETVLEMNAERQKDRPDVAKTSSDAFMLNVCAVLLHLCAPVFAPNQADKTNSIFAQLMEGLFDYIATSKAFPANNTRVGGGDSSTGIKPLQKKQPKFAVRAFALALRALQLGPMAVLRRIKVIQNEMNWLRNRDQEEMPAYKAHEAEIRQISTELFEPAFLQHVLSMCAVTSRWIMTAQLGLKSFEQRNWNEEIEELVLPLSAALSDYRVLDLPDYIVSNIGDFYQNAALFEPDCLDGQSDENLKSVLDFFVAMMGSDAVVKQAHTRAQMGDTILYAFLPGDERHPDEAKPPGYFTRVTKAARMMTEFSQVSKRWLVPMLMKLYGDVEQTGFYEKMTHRQLLSLVLRYLWKFDTHRPAFRSFAETARVEDNVNESPFVKFANGIVNQTNSYVADSISKLRDIHKTQSEQKNSQIWNTEFSEDDRSQRLQQLDENERFVRSSLKFTNEVIHMMEYLSTDESFVRAFNVPALRTRVVDMLCCIVQNLAAKKASELKIENPEKYFFYPRQLLAKVFQILLNCARVVLGEEQDAELFIKAVAGSAFYVPDDFSRAADLVKSFGAVDSKAVVAFTAFNEQCKQMQSALQAEENALGEPPDEFVDQIMGTVMDDPVLLPGSKQIVDRATIEHHLLGAQNDPFDRSPLKPEQVMPQPELKRRIEEWKRGEGL